METTLSRHPHVLSVCVAVKDNRGNSPYLAAFVVPSAAGLTTADQLRDYFRQKLPIYMLPSRFVFVEQLPLLPNGKVDRKALSVGSAPSPEGTLVPPCDRVERQLTGIWRSLLGVEAIGVKDDFFHLGGESLLASTLLTQIEREFNVRLSLSDILDAPTIATLGGVIRRHRQPDLSTVEPEKSASGSSSLVLIQPVGFRPPIFCISGVGVVVFVFQMLARHLGTDQPVYGLQPTEPDGKKPTPMTVPEIAKQYVREMRAVQPDGPFFSGRIFIRRPGGIRDSPPTARSGATDRPSGCV